MTGSKSRSSFKRRGLIGTWKYITGTTCFSETNLERQDSFCHEPNLFRIHYSKNMYMKQRGKNNDL